MKSKKAGQTKIIIIVIYYSAKVVRQSPADHLYLSRKQQYATTKQSDRVKDRRLQSLKVSAINLHTRGGNSIQESIFRIQIDRWMANFKERKREI